ncbi:hypothetical protein MOV08_11610 [Streptomyces yunnanensis]|uniref:Protein kinase domain-containing protein n=1 Tax=Streptomyces yunnanensis TaxID=156453 RepID=A0ABY8A583_9ACTN|nr:hypothetical protein [Streptomyces yunnanensis]WEB39859.1 hypothetical protein MOV08_11610 [Streptomyces yunnanensis]
MLSELLPAMLARDPADRPTAAQALRLLREVAGPQDPLPAPTPTPAPTPAPSVDDAGAPAAPPAGIGRFRGLLIGAGSAAVLGAVVVLAVRILLGGQGPAAPSDGTPTRATDAGSRWGDHRTADPCALVEPSVLGRFGGRSWTPPTATSTAATS